MNRMARNQLHREWAGNRRANRTSKRNQAVPLILPFLTRANTVRVKPSESLKTLTQMSKIMTNDKLVMGLHPINYIIIDIYNKLFKPNTSTQLLRQSRCTV